MIARTREALDAGRASSLSGRLAGGAKLTPKLVCEAAAGGDELATEILTETARWLGIGTVSVLHTIDPDAVLLAGAMTFGGPGSATGELFLETLRAEVRRRAFPTVAEHLDVRFAELGGDAGDGRGRGLRAAGVPGLNRADSARPRSSGVRSGRVRTGFRRSSAPPRGGCGICEKGFWRIPTPPPPAAISMRSALSIAALAAAATPRVRGGRARTGPRRHRDRRVRVRPVRRDHGRPRVRRLPVRVRLLVRPDVRFHLREDVRLRVAVRDRLRLRAELRRLPVRVDVRPDLRPEPRVREFRPRVRRVLRPSLVRLRPRVRVQ